jgi:exosortase
VIWLFLAAFSLGAWPTFLSLGERWLKFDESYSHGFLVLFISLYLCAGTWKRIKPVPGFYWPWLIPLVISALIYMAGDVLLIEAFQQFALVPLILSGLMALLGWRQALPFVVPIGLLVFTLPFWDYLSWSLQVMTVAVNQFMLSWFDIEFIVEGVFVYFPGVGAFEIAEGCSGLRYFLVGVTLALLYGELNLQKWRSRIRLVVASIPAGRVSTYGRVAELADLPRRARLVGRILARLPAGSRLPWHRVVAAGGRIATRGGRSRDGSDDSGAGLQYQRLRAEDVPFRGERVDLRRCGWPDPESP